MNDLLLKLNDLQFSTVAEGESELAFSFDVPVKSYHEENEWKMICVKCTGTIYNLYILHGAAKNDIIDNMPVYLRDIIRAYRQNIYTTPNYIIEANYDPSSFDAWDLDQHKAVVKSIIGFFTCSKFNQTGIYFDRNSLIVTSNFITANEYPEEKYYLDPKDEVNIDGKKQIPFKEVINRNNKALEANGLFVSINYYCKMKWGDPHVYNNDIGKQLISLINQSFSEKGNIISDDN